MKQAGTFALALSWVTEIGEQAVAAVAASLARVRRVLSLHVRLPAVSQPRLPRRILRRPEKEDEASLRKPAQRENN